MDNDNFVVMVVKNEGNPMCEECQEETLMVEVQECSDPRIKQNQVVQFCTYCEMVTI